MNQPIMLKVKEAAARAGVPEGAVRRWIREGSIHAVRSGKRYYVAWKSVIDFLNGEEGREADVLE